MHKSYHSGDSSTGGWSYNTFKLTSLESSEGAPESWLPHSSVRPQSLMPLHSCVARTCYVNTARQIILRRCLRCEESQPSYGETNSASICMRRIETMRNRIKTMRGQKNLCVDPLGLARIDITVLSHSTSSPHSLDVKTM